MNESFGYQDYHKSFNLIEGLGLLCGSVIDKVTTHPDGNQIDIYSTCVHEQHVNEGIVRTSLKYNFLLRLGVVLGADPENDKDHVFMTSEVLSESRVIDTVSFNVDSLMTGIVITTYNPDSEDKERKSICYKIGNDEMDFLNFDIREEVETIEAELEA